MQILFVSLVALAAGAVLVGTGTLLGSQAHLLGFGFGLWLLRDALRRPRRKP